MNTTYLLSQDEILLNLSKITEDLKKMQIENQILRISQKKLEQKMNYTDNIIKLITGYNKVKDDSYIINFLQKYDLLRVFNSTNLQTLIEKNGSNLSLGMQKVIFLVRGLLKDSKIVIIDEPFSSIDQQTRSSVSKMIDETTKGKTVIIITHDEEGLEHILDEIITL